MHRQADASQAAVSSGTHIGRVSSIQHNDTAFPQDLEASCSDNNRRRFVDTNAQKLRVFEYDADQAVFTLPPNEMLVENTAFKKAKPFRCFNIPLPDPREGLDRVPLVGTYDVGSAAHCHST